MTAPIAFELIEDAIVQWLELAVPGITVYMVEPEDSGAPLPAPPRVQLLQVSGPTAISQPELRRVPSIMIQRVQITAGGPASAGVDFRLGFAQDPERIEVDLLPGDDAGDGAAKLLAELVLELPAGVTAAIDPEDAAAIIVTGSAAQPLFSCSPVGVTSVTTLRERFPTIHASWSRMTWRCDFSALATRGLDTAVGLMERAKVARARMLVPRLQAAGWEYKGELQAQGTIAASRNESSAVFDFAIEGYSTVAFQDPALRLVAYKFQPQP